MTRHKNNASKKKVTQTSGAKALGVSREHLNRVLNGRRTSRRLLARWNELKGAVA